MIEKLNPQKSTPDINELHRFYSWEHDNEGNIKVTFNRLLITMKLRELGYYRYDEDGLFMFYVYLHNRRVQIVEEAQIIDAFEDYIKNLPPRKVSFMIRDNEVEKEIDSYILLDTLYRNLQTWFSTLQRLRPQQPIEILKDERKSKFFFFNNTAVQVSDSGVQYVPYEELKANIWEGSVLKRNFTYSEKKGYFERFFENICNNDTERKEAAMTLLGYLMHDYYEYNLAAVMLTDVNLTTTGKPAGRTGKGLIGKALGQMLNKTEKDTKYVSIAGKGFNHDEGDGKCYSKADLSTQLIHIEDLGAYFDLEPLFYDITDGCKMRKLHRDPVTRKVKFMLSMNNTMRNFDGSSYTGRLYIFELANYYSDTHRPTDDFPYFWGEDWTNDDWNEFYSFMIRCQFYYFQRGIQQPKDINYMQRSLKESLPEDFYYWFEDYIKNAVTEKTRVQYKKIDLMNAYRNKYFLSEKDQPKFTRWVKRYLDRMSIPYKEVRSTYDLIILYPTSND